MSIKRFGLLSLIAAIALAVIGFGSATTGVGATGSATLTMTAPASALITTPFTATVAADVTPITPATTFFGYNSSIAWDSTYASVTGILNDAPTSCTGWADAGGGVTLTDQFGGLYLPIKSVSIAHGSTAGTTGPCNVATYQFTATATTGYMFLHQIKTSEVPPAAVGSGLDSELLDATTAQLPYTTVCGGALCYSNPPFPPLCAPIGCATPADNLVAIVAPPPVLTVTKGASNLNPTAGIDPETWTINVTSTGTTPTGLVVTDTVPAQFPTANLTSTLPVGCSFAGQLLTCTGVSTPLTITLTYSAADPLSGGTQACNQAAASDTNPGGNPPANPVKSANVCVNIASPAVAWSKNPTQCNLWLAASNAGPALTGCDQLNTFTFDELLANPKDPHGLGGFSFDIHYDPTQYQLPSVDMSPAVAIFAAASRTLQCTMTIPQNGDIHEACASLGAFGSGPSWNNAKVMAHVTLTPQSFLVEAIRPNKENGDVSTVKDDQVTVTNTCGQPLNDGSIQPLPNQPECQGAPLPGVGPGGVLNGNPNGGETTQTIRRLEGDVTNDCVVGLSDMQLEASKFGQSIGGLLYSLWFDVNSPLQHGDGEIDINDIQFVFGRNGSTCAHPIPAQPSLPPLP